MWRAGGNESPTLADMLTLKYSNIIRTDYLKFGIGYGWDVGTQVVYNITKKIALLGGAAMTDVGNTLFASGGNAQPSNFSMGAGIRMRTREMQLTLSYAMQHAFDDIDWRKKMHIGLEVKLPILSLYAGMNQLYPTFGAALDLLFFKLLYTSYAEDLGVASGVQSERRHLVNVEVKFDM
jgi:hypothetical protein